MQPIIAKERHGDFRMIASQTSDFLNQNVVELELNIVVTFEKNKNITKVMFSLKYFSILLNQYVNNRSLLILLFAILWLP